MIRNIRRTTIHKIWRDNLHDPIHNNLQDPIHDTIKKRYYTQNDCRFAISPEGAGSPALPGTGQTRDDNSLRSSDLTRIKTIRKKALALPGAYRTMKWLEWWLTLCPLVGIAGHARCRPFQIMACRTVTAVGARPSSFAPIFGASPQYCMLGTPSILRSLVESRDVQTFARPVDLVGETISSEAGSARLARPKRHPPRRSSPTWGPSFRSAARRGPPSYSSLLGTA